MKLLDSIFGFQKQIEIASIFIKSVGTQALWKLLLTLNLHANIINVNVNPKLAGNTQSV